MSEQHAASALKPSASPWPIPLVLGFVVAEVCIVFGGAFIPFAVGGLLLFGGSVAGILHESGFVTRRWRSALGIAALYGTAGILVVTQTSALVRGQAMLGAALVAAFASLASYLYETERL